MKIQFFGAAGTVTGSRYLVTFGETKILVDCGLFQGFKNLRLQNWDQLPFDVSTLDAVVLTHAHLDHSGAIPLLSKRGFRGKIYCTEPTLSLCEILLPDSGYLQEEEARFANKKGFSKHHPALPLYSLEDARQSLELFETVPWHTRKKIGKNGQHPMTIEFFRAGHLLGAASLRLTFNGRTLVFSGDLGRSDDPLLQEPELQTEADYIVVESTYGNRVHPSQDPKDQLEEIVNKTLRRGGTLLIPSFAVGRAQLILYYLHQLKAEGRIPRSVPVYLNSPMATEANKAYLKHPQDLKLSLEEIQALWDSVRIVSSAEDSKMLNEKNEPAIIIAASGMATGGRVLHHLKKIAPDPKNTILFVGFQAGGTRGDVMVRGAREVKIHGLFWPIHAEVINMETLSAHADSVEILNWLRHFRHPVQNVFVTHGEPEAAEALRASIQRELTLQATVPSRGEGFEL